jgi:Cu/Ag efflux protein CusF
LGALNLLTENQEFCMKKIIFAALFAVATIVNASGEWTNAQVIRVDASKSRLFLKHDEIKSIGMPSMSMSFDISKSVDLSKYQPNDQIRFQLKQVNGYMEISQIERVK